VGNPSKAIGNRYASLRGSREGFYAFPLIVYPKMCDNSNIPREKRPSKEEIAKHIYNKLSKRTLSLKQVYKVLVDEPYFVEEVKKALRHLRQQKKPIGKVQIRKTIPT
jgi:hypothetical protein